MASRNHDRRRAVRFVQALSKARRLGGVDGARLKAPFDYNWSRGDGAGLGWSHPYPITWAAALPTMTAESMQRLRRKAPFRTDSFPAEWLHDQFGA